MIRSIYGDAATSLHSQRNFVYDNEEHRLLKVGEVVLETDEFLVNGRQAPYWKVLRSYVHTTVHPGLVAIRRKL